MNDVCKAVFLSYASQDTEAARRICDALRAAGIEVWFDQSELRGGDAWDANIRKQIKECRLFLPVISANTQARTEGYFRLEWKQAVYRLDDIADNVPFLVPVVIDDTTKRGTGATGSITVVRRCAAKLWAMDERQETAGNNPLLPRRTRSRELRAESRRFEINAERFPTAISDSVVTPA